MLNAKALSDLLSRNSDDRLCKRWYLMTPNGTLLANTQPVDVRDLRRQVAMTALSWQEHQRPADSEDEDAMASDNKQQPALHTLIIESEAGNVLVRQLQPQLLLVLEGGVPPRKQPFEPRVTAAGEDGELLHSASAGQSSSVSSYAESSNISSVATNGVLGLHRKKLDAMTAAIVEEFERTGFAMPNDSINKLF